MALLAVLAAAFVVVSLLARVKARAVRWWAAAVILVAASVAVFFVDVNVPLSESHLYPVTTPAPLWLALLAAFARFSMFATIILMRDLLHQPAREPRSEANEADA
ncbi:MAG TPA: hypothetical protein VGD45_08505 [Steroidobacter sp.]|uniref:hypothetical protein n=1 Tax=Steroidobacter sp. TaxID=1978227 RepID=UPI002ED9FC92